jgi:predicted metalloprotease
MIVALLLTLLVLPAGASDTKYTADAKTSIADIQSFWSSTMPTVYKRAYSAIPADHVYAYSSSNPPPGCGTRGRTPYQDVAGNAFYCDEGNFVAYDAEQLIPKMRSSFGDFAVGLVLAHELGHAVQSQVGYPGDASIYVELQADCFAGAWAQHIANGTDTSLRLSTTDLDRALAGFLQLRDPSGVDGGQDGAHGNAFDRVSAFQDGLDGGAAACKAYTRTPPAVTELGFTSSADQAVNGDLSLDKALPILKDSLDAYWSQTARVYKTAPKVTAARGSSIPACPGGSDGGVLSETVVYCADNNTITYASATLDGAERDIGDLGAGVYIAAAWSSAVEHAIGIPLGTTQARSTAECLTGAWAASVQDGTASGAGTSSFSPGDLDEIVATFVATGDASHGSDVDRSTVFDRIARFRTGFDSGPSACVNS